MPRARLRHYSGGRSQRLTQWAGPAAQEYIAVASGGATLVASLAFEEPATVMRTRGRISVKPTSVAADLAIVGAIGLGIVSAEAFTAGVASIPEPFSDADWGGWFVWQSFAYQFEFADATGVNYADWNFVIDSKAMRKVSPSEVVVQIVESFTGAFSVATPVRMLVKLT